MQYGSKQALPFQSRGFSLTEVVVSVSLVGIVAAFAMPHFTRLSNGARASEVVALGSRLRHSAETAHVQYIMSGARLSAAVVEGKTVQLKNGYPEASSTGIGNAVFESQDFAMRASGDVVVFSKSDAASASECAVTYRAASAAGEAAVIANLNTRGC
ncbi:MAG TPA: prepilin-type N-terminal cleavage/methylation domain-containing protein [Steroidobacteraceae bacterium]|jgi:MSHA pilin protein MshA|nr:prepilin-type N-terminal cleavage/methylation domain-containing protein [Steroidobacteraceae bacterium]